MSTNIDIKGMHNPPHPGEVLREYLGETTITAAAVKLGVNRVTLNRIVTGASGISADMAYRLASAFGTSAVFWAGMQLKYDLYQAGMLKRPRIERVRNNRASARNKIAEHQTRQLTVDHEETLKLYSQGKIGASEAKADLTCDSRELITLLSQRGLTLPHVSLALAEKMANEALALMNIPISNQPKLESVVHHG